MSLAAHLLSSGYGSHAVYLYRELDVFRSTYAEFCKTALPQGEIIVILSHYETIDEVKDTLMEIGIWDVEQYLKDGVLFIFHSADAYLIDANGTFKLARSLVERAKKENKKGVTVLADMGSFFEENKIKELIEYESSLPIKYDGNLRGYCFYLQSDFDKLNSIQKNTLLKTHNESGKIQS